MQIDGPDGHRYFVSLHHDVYRPDDDTMLLDLGVDGAATASSRSAAEPGSSASWRPRQVPR